MNEQNNLANKNNLNYWLFAIGPFAMIVVYVLYLFNLHTICNKKILEYLHLVLIASAFVTFTITAIKQKEIFHFIMTALCFSFLCRELHFAGTSMGVYIAIAIIATYTILKFEQVEPVIERGEIKSWLYATAFTYILSQLIARRVFRQLHLPNEQYLHIILEEMVETMAHLMMLITAITTSRTKKDPFSKTVLSQKEENNFTDTNPFDTFDLNTR